MPLFDVFGSVWPKWNRPHSGLPAIDAQPPSSFMAWARVRKLSLGYRLTNASYRSFHITKTIGVNARSLGAGDRPVTVLPHPLLLEDVAIGTAGRRPDVDRRDRFAVDDRTWPVEDRLRPSTEPRPTRWIFARTPAGVFA